MCSTMWQGAAAHSVTTRARAVVVKKEQGSIRLPWSDPSDLLYQNIILSSSGAHKHHLAIPPIITVQSLKGTHSRTIRPAAVILYMARLSAPCLLQHLYLLMSMLTMLGAGQPHAVQWISCSARAPAADHPTLPLYPAPALNLSQETVIPTAKHAHLP